MVKWVEIGNMPNTWKKNGKLLSVWGWPTYAAADEDGTDDTKIVSQARWNSEMGRPYGGNCTSHFTVTHVALSSSPDKARGETTSPSSPSSKRSFETKG